jgi:hypothetical protein
VVKRTKKKENKKMYVKILVGENKGKTLYVKEKRNDGNIIISSNGKIYEYISSDYIEQKVYLKSK